MMSLKGEVLGGIRFSYLAVWTMAGFGMTMAFYSSRKWFNYCNRELVVFAREENDDGIDLGVVAREENDDGIDLGVVAQEENDDGIDLGVVAREENDDGIDRLPNDILCNIVSRLKLIEASRTSILSSRWRKIWTMNPDLIFDCIRTLNIPQMYHDHIVYGHVERFLKAVDQCLHLYSGGKLKTLTIDCCFLKNHPYHLVRWMETIAKLDVEKLFLGHSCQLLLDVGSGRTPDKRFTFSFKLIDGLSKLQNLELVSCNVVTSFVGQCNSLTYLALWGVSLLRNELSDILLSCPNLTTLCINECELTSNFKISGRLKLEVLQIYLCHHVKKIEISCVNLEKILINIRTEAEVVLSCVPKLESLDFITPGMNYCFEDIPRDLPQIQYLMVQATQQILRLPPTFRVFRNLRRLYLLTAADYNGIAWKEVDLWNFAPVLSACPLLEKFYLMVGGPLCKEERKVVRQWSALRHKHLEHMELSGFRNRENELEFAKFILTSAEALRYLTLKTTWRSYDVYRFVYYYDVKDSIEIDAEAVCENLRGHALSMLTKVEVI